MVEEPRIVVRVERRIVEASGALQLELRSADGMLPGFTAGAHIDMFLPNGLIRSYSLMNLQGEQNRYVCGIGLDSNSRGGSAYIHQHVQQGDQLTIGPPKNNFPLVETAAQSVLFAGGIGVTPIIGMVRRLSDIGGEWRMYYCARSRSEAPFLEDVSALGKIDTHFDNEAGEPFLDIGKAVANAQSGAHFYCCGPVPMIAAFGRATVGIPSMRVHLERFASDQAAATEGGYTVELAKSGLSLRVQSGQTILETIEEAGLDVPFSCLAGICGSCVTKVLEGVPDHRDMVLTDREKARNDQMMICCSGSLSSRLVLDR